MGVLKIYSKFTGEHPCRSVISINLQSNVIETTLRHGCSPVNLKHIFRTLFTKNVFILKKTYNLQLTSTASKIMRYKIIMKK